METVQIELTDAEFCVLAKLAHEQDITFNKLIESILREYINLLNNIGDSPSSA